MEQGNYDVAIIGCGPAGLSAAVNVSIRQKSAAIFGGELCAPKLYRSPLVTNYLGLPEIAGQDLRKKFLAHVRSFDVPVHQVRVDSVRQDGDSFAVQVGGALHKARAIILATGVTVFKLFEGEQQFIGKGVGYCATCDGPLYKGKDVAVISYTAEGMEEANFLAGFCRRVYFIPLGEFEEKKIDQRVDIIRNEEPGAILGGDLVTGLKLKNRDLPVEGVFIYRQTFLPDQLVPGLTVEENHIKINRDFSTNIKGVFAAGDCTGKPYGLAKAVGEGQAAGLNASSYLDNLH